jgi:hypothetical protein
MTTTELDRTVDHLLSEYLAVCNRSLRENADTRWYQKAKRLNRKLWGDSDFRTIVYGQDPSDVLGEHTIRFDADAMTLDLARTADDDTAFAWKVPISYLQDVVDRPDWYVANPLQLDLKWFGERIRTEASAPVRDRSMLAKVGLLIAVGAVLCVGARLLIRSRKKRSS